jgi:hypothetical protein
MYYSGAIKSAVYGLYLRFVTPQFSVISWRLTGILMVALGLMAFVLLVHRSVSTGVLAVIVGLLLTDVTVILCTRHDWGPVALALMLRLLLIGVWLRGEGMAQSSLGNSFVLGALVGFAVFEKLSSFVLLLPLALFSISKNRRSVHSLLAALGGLLVGALPLLVANLLFLVARGQLISLTDIGTVPTRTWYEFLQYIWAYLSLGAGENVTYFILGNSTLPLATAIEPWLMTTALMLASSVVWLLGLRERAARLTFVAILCYAGIAILIYLIPRETSVHHWVLGTPFQYVAVGLAFDALRDYTSAMPIVLRLLRFLLRLAVGVLLTVRLAGLWSLENMLWQGEASRTWHPNLTQLGVFAAKHADEAVFVAADWGVLAQIFCLSNGRHGLVQETFWSYKGPDELLSLRKKFAGKVVYVVSLNPPSDVRSETTEKIFHDFERSLYWRETFVEPEAGSFTAVTVRKFLFDPAPHVFLSRRGKIFIIGGRSTNVDFNGDRKSDIGVYRDGAWLVLRSDSRTTAMEWGGLAQDIPVPADYDGDGKVDIAVYREGMWFIKRSSDRETAVVVLGGLAQDIMVPGDYDGDWKTDQAVYRAGLWLIQRSSDRGQTTVSWGGAAQDTPVLGDYDGDGKTDVAVYRGGAWLIRRSADGGEMTVGWGGLAQDIPVPGDYDGDGKTDVAVYRGGTWLILRSFDGAQSIIHWGGAVQDVPLK